ncbi:MAG: hypothetical protein AAFZ92_10115, partial [Pseudomonadota bacterium]
MEGIYIAFTLMGIVVKLWALKVISQTWKQTLLYQLVTLFILLFLCQSTFELMLYFMEESSVSGFVALKGYYLFTLLMASTLPFMVARFSRYSIPKQLVLGIGLANVMTLSLLLFSETIILGVDHTGITLTRIAGRHYWLFQLAVLISVLYSIYILFLCKKSTSNFVKIRANNILLSFSLVACFVIGIIIVMHFVEGINAVGLLPLLASLFIFAIVDDIRSKNIVDYSYWVPFSKKRQQINQLVRPFITINSDGLKPSIKKEY